MDDASIARAINPVSLKPWQIHHPLACISAFPLTVHEFSPKQTKQESVVCVCGGTRVHPSMSYSTVNDSTETVVISRDYSSFCGLFPWMSWPKRVGTGSEADVGAQPEINTDEGFYLSWEKLHSSGLLFLYKYYNHLLIRATKYSCLPIYRLYTVQYVCQRLCRRHLLFLS